MLIEPKKLVEMTEAYQRLCIQHGAIGAWHYMEWLYRPDELDEFVKAGNTDKGPKLLNE